MILVQLQCNGGQKKVFAIELALRLAAEREPVGGMQDAVENRVSEGGIIEKGCGSFRPRGIACGSRT